MKRVGEKERDLDVTLSLVEGNVTLSLVEGDDPGILKRRFLLKFRSAAENCI
jgi:hypothetical protein